jgi:hypothetical protein
MAFTEGERVQIRRYLGYSRLYLQSDSRLESVMTSIQSQADGGSSPDSATEDLIRSLLDDLTELQKNMKALWTQAQALDADGLKIDVARAVAVLRSEGRRLVGEIADQLEVHPRRDVFAPKPLAREP